MTSKELVTLISKIIKKEFAETRKTLKEEIKNSVRSEINQILEDASQIRHQETNTSLSNILKEQHSPDISNMDTVFKHKGKIFDILNETANEYKNKKLPPDTGVHGQQEYILNTQNTAIQTPPINKAALAEKMGYGNMTSNPSVPVPGNEQPVAIQLPTTNPDGRPINLNKVDPNIIQNMIKNYSSIMKKVDEKAKRSRGV